ncbi:MAG: DNA polymerase III subunit delta' [Oscillospiraceae bacterium]|nr:DNA polymerase III subunit delta' [Oscillospiraceae bacterium]
MTIYGNKHITDTLKNMLASGRMAHSFLIYGETGLGKKTMAQYLAKMLVCESTIKPCSECRACRNVENKIHPDVIYVQHTGKLNGFSVDTIRNICTDAYVRPNNADVKVYILSDADNITVSAQNSLLKLIEEPPEYVYFIFTAVSKNVFLDTIISRVISMAVSPVADARCMEALAAAGIDDQTAGQAVEAFGGNIGMCLEYACSDDVKKLVQLTKRAADCIIKRDEYALNKCLSEAEADKPAVKKIIFMLDNIIRDALAGKFDGSMTGCYKDGARELGSVLTMSSCENMHDACSTAFGLIDKNVNLKLITASFCSELMTYR